ncbi:MAG: hypothetical protein RMA76_42225 [Deltaproteobacteria bacterium]|jgi:hypothetical protein
MRGVVATMVLLAAVLGPRAVRADGDSLVVIVHPSCPLDEISKADLRQIFTHNRVPHPTGKAWIPLNTPVRTRERVTFDLLVLDKTPEEVGRFWVDQRIRAQSRPPRVVPSVRISARVVERLPTGIAYVPKALVPPGVKILRVDGRASL